MRRGLRLTGTALFAALSVFFVWFGWLYVTVEEPLSFHAAAVPEAARSAVRPLYFALMNLVGGASAALGLLGLFTTATAIRRGSRAAAAALAASYAVALVAAALTAEELARTTGAPTSWRLMGVLLAFTTLAFGASLAGGQSAPPR